LAREEDHGHQRDLNGAIYNGAIYNDDAIYNAQQRLRPHERRPEHELVG